MFRRLSDRLRGARKKPADTFGYTVSELNRIKAASDVLTQRLGQPIGQGFKERRSSDTLFILGSGPSVNDLTPEELDLIAGADSVGFNWWPAHPLVPSFLMFQFPPGMEQDIAALLARRVEEYADVPVILRGTQLGRRAGELEEMLRQMFTPSQLFFMNEFPIHSRCEIDIAEMITFVRNLGLFDFGAIPDFFVKWRGTLGLLVSFGYAMGYRRIVLVGIDMTPETAHAHFFDSPSYAALRSEINLPPPAASNIRTMMDRDYAKNTVGAYIEALNWDFRSRDEVLLEVASEKSALASFLPPWTREWQGLP